MAETVSGMSRMKNYISESANASEVEEVRDKEIPYAVSSHKAATTRKYRSKPKDVEKANG